MAEETEAPKKKSSINGILAMIIGGIIAVVAIVFNHRGADDGNTLKMLGTQVAQLSVMQQQDQKNITAAEADIQALKNDSQDKPRLYTAYTLVLLANQFAKTDPASAMTLLKQAHAQLSNTPNEQALITSINNDLQTLAKPETADNTSELYQQLSTLMQQVASISPMATKPLAPAIVNAVIAHTPIAWWKEALGKTWGKLKSLVVVQKNTANLMPLATPEQIDLVRYQLTLLITQAEWAVLEKNQAIYKSSLSETQTLLTRYFSNNPETLYPMNDTLTTLIATPITVAKPMTLESPAAFENALEVHTT